MSGTPSTSTGRARLIGRWRPPGNVLFAFWLLAVCGLGGVVALIVLKGQLPNKELPTALMIFFIFLALCLGIPGAAGLYGSLTNGGTRLYEDRLEVHFYLWPWKVSSYQLTDIAGIGLYLHEFLMPQPNSSMPRTERQWQCVILSSPDEVAIEDSIQTTRDSSPSKLSPQSEDDLKQTKAAEIVAKTYQQALVCQGPGGKLSNPIHLASIAAEKMAEAGSEAPTLIASWSPYDGLKMVGSDPTKVDATGLPVADKGKGGRQSPDSWTYVEELDRKDPKVHALRERLKPVSPAASGWSHSLASILGPSEVVAAGAEASNAKLTSPIGDVERTRHANAYMAALVVTNERVLYLDSPPPRYLQWRLQDLVFVQPIERDPTRMGHRTVSFSVVDGTSMEVDLSFAKAETISQLAGVLKGKDNQAPQGT